jgi:hypothetical protein
MKVNNDEIDEILTENFDIGGRAKELQRKLWKLRKPII